MRLWFLSALMFQVACYQSHELNLVTEPARDGGLDGSRDASSDTRFDTHADTEADVAFADPCDGPIGVLPLIFEEGSVSLAPSDELNALGVRSVSGVSSRLVRDPSEFPVSTFVDSFDGTIDGREIEIPAVPYDGNWLAAGSRWLASDDRIFEIRDRAVVNSIGVEQIPGCASTRLVRSEPGYFVFEGEGCAGGVLSYVTEIGRNPEPVTIRFPGRVVATEVVSGELAWIVENLGSATLFFEGEFIPVRTGARGLAKTLDDRLLVLYGEVDGASLSFEFVEIREGREVTYAEGEFPLETRLPLIDIRASGGHLGVMIATLHSGMGSSYVSIASLLDNTLNPLSTTEYVGTPNALRVATSEHWFFAWPSRIGLGTILVGVGCSDNRSSSTR